VIGILSKSYRPLSIVTAASIALLMAYLISTWVHSAGTAGEVTLFYADHLSSANRELISRFNKRYAGKIKVEAIDLPFAKFSTNERKELLARTLRSRSERLDIFSVDVIWIPRFAKWAMPLDDRIKPRIISEIIPAVRDIGRHEDDLVALPFYTDLMHMYFRRDIIRQWQNGAEVITALENGITWPQLDSLHSQYGGQHPAFLLFPGKSFEGLTCLFTAGIASLGGQLQSAEDGSFTHPNAQRSLAQLRHLLERKIAPHDVLAMDEYLGYQYAIRQNAVFFIGWPGLIEQHLNPGDSLIGQLSVAPLPHFSDGKKVAVFGGWNFMVSRYSKNPAAAITFLEFAFAVENQKRIHELGGYIPVNRTVYNDNTFLQQHPRLRFYRELMPYGIYRPKMENYTLVSDILARHLQRGLTSLPVDVALSQASSEVAMSVGSRQQ
jgi:multiple sugar transport system substrate-binding protein